MSRKNKDPVNRFAVRTRLARAAGKDTSRYASSAIRALPSVNKDEAVLQATDGRQAVCLVTEGRMAESRLVPSSVLPTRRLRRSATIEKVNGDWRSTEGRLAEDEFGTGEGSFPPIADVLPAVHRRPYYETAAQAQRRREADSAVESVHVVLGVDVDLLRKTADALGTSRITMFVPVPVRSPAAKAGETYVNKPVPICPADGTGSATGVAVVMPLHPERANRCYEQVRRVVVESEQKVANGSKRPQGTTPTT